MRKQLADQEAAAKKLQKELDEANADREQVQQKMAAAESRVRRRHVLLAAGCRRLAADARISKRSPGFLRSNRRLRVHLLAAPSPLLFLLLLRIVLPGPGWCRPPSWRRSWLPLPARAAACRSALRSLRER